MKLYFSPGACCMSCHIALEETKTPFELAYAGKKMDEKARADFLKVSPLGAVPTFELDDGRILTQNIAILEYIADQKPEYQLLDKPGSYERADIMRWLSFAASDFHKAFGPLFRMSAISDNPVVQDALKQHCFSMIEKYCDLLNTHLKGKNYLACERFTVADAYVFTIYQWTAAVKFPTEKYAELNRYADAIAKRPSVIAVHQRESAY